MHDGTRMIKYPVSYILAVFQIDFIITE